MKFQNPVLSGFYPDPSVCRVGEDYYLVTSSFEYFPGIPIFHSRDLVHWRQIGHCLDRRSQLQLDGADASGGIYAPTLRHHEGRFYMTTTNVSHGGNFIVSADTPEGPWSDPVYVKQEGIDPSLFFDRDGSVIYTTSRGGALQSRINIDTGELLTKPQVVWEGTGGQHPEGPHLYFHQDWYYLLMAEGGTEYMHMVIMARSRSPWGPFESCPRNPVLTHRSQWSSIHALGHADLVESPDGHWAAVCLGIRPVGYPPCYHLGRETFLSPVSWVEDGFPVFGKQGRLEEEMELPLAAQPQEGRSEPVRDDFDDGKLALCWNFLRNPVDGLVSLKERPGFLRLHGSADGLDDKASPAWVGRRQCHFDLDVATWVEFTPVSDNEEAGLVLRMNEKHHYEIFLTRRDNKNCVVLRRRIGSLQAEVASREIPESKTPSRVLAVHADRQRYTFLEGATAQTLEALGTGETRYLSTEVAGGFTGVYVAMYASGRGKACQNPADFDWFELWGRS